MDEILTHSQPEVGAQISDVIRAESSAADLGAKLRTVLSAIRTGAVATKKFSQYAWHALDGALVGRRLLSPLPFLAISGIAALALVVGTVYTPSYVVSIDGTDLGTVSEPAVFEQVIDRVEQRASSILGYDYTLDQNAEYTFALIQKDKLSPVGTFETYLFNQVGEVMKSYVLTVNGEFIGASSDRSALDSMLESLVAPYTTGDTVDFGYVEDVKITYEHIPSDAMQDIAAMKDILSANTTGQTTYEVVKGDTYLGIAHANNMSLDELMALNPQASLNRLMIGDVLTVKKTIPYLSIRTVDTLTYKEEIPCPVEEIQDSNMYKGNKKVVTAGTPGEALVTANVTYINGYEEGREIIESITLSEATTEVVRVGTKPRPKTMPTGTFRWPLSGRITSSFGHRIIFGASDYHGGIDIAANYGTSIVASDGGTVVWSGTKGTYGKLVIIDHGSGIRTYYGHCSSLLVSAGDKVYKGQTIARVGSTGRSTGNHCHFEIRINGTRVNPRSYLPK